MIKTESTKRLLHNRYFLAKEIIEKSKQSRNINEFNLSQEGKWSFFKNKRVYTQQKELLLLKSTKEGIVRKFNNVYKNWDKFKKTDQYYNCKKNFPSLLISLKHKSDNKKNGIIETSIDRREDRFQMSLSRKIKRRLSKHSIAHKVKLEHVVKAKGSKIRIDIVIDLIDYNESINVEVKHDDSYCSKEHLKEQRDRYQRMTGSLETYVVSPNGKYGISEKEFLSIKDVFIEREEIVPYSTKDVLY